MPEVAATAAPVHSTAAPGYVDEPAITPVTPWVYLSSCGPGTGQRTATSTASKPSRSVSGRPKPMSTRRTRPQSASAWTGFRPPKVTVSAACTAGPVIAPVATSMPLGMSTATTGIALASTASKTLAASGRSGPEPEIPTTPSITRPVDSATPLTIRPPAFRNAANPFWWVRSGFSRIASAAAPQEGRRPQRVTAVVAGADHRAHTAAGNPAGKGNQLGDDRIGQSVGRARHQRAVGQAGQQRRFGLADHLSRVVVPHSPACPPLRLFDRLLRIAPRALHRRRSACLTGSSASRRALCIVAGRLV